jgi:acyl transferase domain-containing protein
LTRPDIAIVGLGGVFPGAPTLEDFYEIIAAGRDVSSEASAQRWGLPPAAIFQPWPPAPDKAYALRGYFIDGFEPDTSGLDLDPALVSRLDPACQLLLHAGRQAFQSCVTDGLDRTRAGVILGQIALPTEAATALAMAILGESLKGRRPEPAPEPGHTSFAALNRRVTGLPAQLLIQALGLGGTGYTLDAACASSLYAVKLACDQLLSGRADLMLAGGMSRPDCLYTQMGFSQLRALSPSGRCAPFDVQGDGLLVGEGAGVVVLKRLPDAQAAGDRIWGLIRGWGLSNDIEGSLLAPAAEGQIRAMKPAYLMAGWNPWDVDLIECHATGTPVGDRVEFDSLKRLWDNAPPRQAKCVLGSVKSGVGHLLTGAGAAGLIKVLLAMKNGLLPPTANFTTPHPGLGLAESPFEVLTAARPWPAAAGPRKAAVSGFGFGGINAHLLVEEWTEDLPARARPVPENIGPTAEPIAVVGLAASVGPWSGLEALTRRWFADHPAPSPKPRAAWQPAESNLPDGYYIDQVKLPIGGFRIPPSEMADMLPQQAQMLLTAAEALARAGYAPQPQSRAGVYVGLDLDLNTTNYHFRWSLEQQALQRLEQAGRPLPSEIRQSYLEAVKAAAGPPLTADRTLGALGSITASRIAREFKMGGAGHTVSSGETSGLQALELAVRALQAGELDLAVAGAVDFGGDLRTLRTALKEDIPGQIPFRGFTPAEGAVAVVLQRLSDAEKDGRPILAVIRNVASATIHPGPEAGHLQQARTLALDQICREVGLDPENIEFVETTDRVLAPNALTQQVQPAGPDDREKSRPIYGRVAADTGHVGAAGGLAALARTVLALDLKMLPAWCPGPDSSTPSAGLNVPPAPGYWVRNRRGPRLAAVRSVNALGGCTQVVLEEYPANQAHGSVEILEPGPDELSMLVVAADDPAGLMVGLHNLQSYALEHSDLSLAHVSRHRPVAEQREGRLAVALLAITSDDLRRQIDSAVSGLESGVDRIREERLFYESRPLGPEGGLAFVFPGSGNHFPGMGLDLSRHWPGLFRQLEKDNQFLKDQFAADDFWYGRKQDLDHRALIGGQVAVGAAVYAITTGLGLLPAAVIGHSLGESASLFATGAWQDRDEMLRRMSASTLFTRDLAGEYRAARTFWNLSAEAPLTWSTGVVNCSEGRLRALLSEFPRVFLQIVNAPEECVIGGETAAVKALVSRLGCFFMPLAGVTTVHCEIVRQVAEAYRELHLFETVPPRDVTIYSAAWGRAYRPDRETAADSITEQALGTMHFPRLIEQAHADGLRLFLEMGPGESCTRMITRILGDRPHDVRAVYTSTRDCRLSIWQALAWAATHRVDFAVNTLQLPSNKTPLAEIASPRPEIVIPTDLMPMELPPFPEQPAEPTIVRREHRFLPEPLPSPAGTETLHGLESLIQGLAETQRLQAEAHGSFLRQTEGLSRAMTENLAFQMQLCQGLTAENLANLRPPVTEYQPAAPARQPRWFMDRRQCLEFAVGSIQAVLGDRYAEIDTFPTRVRLPDQPLMLVDRVVSVTGEPLSLKSGQVVTEHDVLVDGWYLDNGRIPTCIAIEAGQADLFLSGYLGIDFETRGLAVYRLLDAEVTFQGPLPQPGHIISYDIRIERFFRHGETYLFRFNFDATVNGEPLMAMRNGCAGFFTPQELASGKGLVKADLDTTARPGKLPQDWVELAPPGPMALDESRVEALYRDDLETCFGPDFAGLGLRSPLTLPGGRLRLIDRVLHLDHKGGRYGLGVIKTEMDIHPDDWFLTCHFVDDMVMPGTLMYECCLHSLRIFLISLGWVGEKDRVACQPLAGVPSKLKCRGQVVTTTKKAAYEIFIKELGYGPEPYALADGIMYADGRPVVLVEDMTIRLTGLDRAELLTRWGKNAARDDRAAVVFTREQVLALAQGKPSDAFGEPYRPFDEGRFVARLPRPPYSFIDRIVEVRDSEPFRMKPGAVAVAEYLVPEDDWYFRDNGGLMPFSVLLETALQPCGWLAAYSGSALTSPDDLYFRNLGGSAVQKSLVHPGQGLLTTEAVMTRASRSGGMIIQHFDFRVTHEQRSVYEGNTYFGFFTKASLAAQAGLQGVDIPRLPEAGPADAWTMAGRPGFPQGMILMLDEIVGLSLSGGPHGLGWARGRKVVNPEEWFFKAHFFQDPVWPGSLGVEAFLQLLQALAMARWPLDIQAFESCALGRPHQWIYRGQVIPANREVLVEAVVTEIDEKRRIIQADGFLSVDGLAIYQMKDFAVRGLA